MAESRLYGLGTQLDISQILSEAQHRWLRPAEICEILRNYIKFVIAPEPANRPPSGSLFLFDRKVLRYFRKDGHSWRKKKDGKTVKEAHERLKAGRIDVLHCYYAHGEENENFQRRSYWLLEEELSNIVLVHYREVKGNRTNFNRIKEAGVATPNSVETDDTIPNSEADSSVSSKYHSFNYQVNSQTTNATSPNSTQASEYEDAESAYNHQPSSSFRSFLDMQPPIMERGDDPLAAPYYPVPFSNDYEGKFQEIHQMDFIPLSRGGKGKNSCDGGNDFPSWGNDLGNYSTHYQPSLPSAQLDTLTTIPGRGNETLGQPSIDAFGSHTHGQEQWQASEGNVQHISKFANDPRLNIDPTSNLTTRFHEGQVRSTNSFIITENAQPFEQNLHHTNAENVETNLTIEAKSNYSASKPPLLGGFIKEGLKKLDSFDRWMSKELGDVKESQMQSSSGTYWDAVGSEDGVDDSTISRQEQLDTYMLSPSLSQDQLFSIGDFSPNWAYSGSEIKVLIMGTFLKSQQDVEKCKWACMFGEVEVPAEVVLGGLRCYTPEHKGGRVPFYVTCSNRLACSEVREFEFKINNNVREVDLTDDTSGGTSAEILLHMRFGKFLSLGSSTTFAGPDSNLSDKISSLLKEDDNEWDQMMMLTNEDMFSADKVRDRLLQKLLKEKLHVWLLHKAAEGGKGPSVVDEGGQGVLHFAAALGYDWAIQPTIAAGVSINFRDVNGWTALHWAASCGRERTVAFLISLDAIPGLLTDPTPTYPLGRTPADLASINGHKGIAGYLAESSIHHHFSSLTLKDKTNKAVAIQTITERAPTPLSNGDYPQGLSMKDSLAAVCSATQAAARIHQVFRVQSFQKKQLKEYGDSDFGLSDERALSLLAVKTNKGGGYRDEPVTAAAVRIQNKFRSWKGRKDFLIIRQRIVKIQAHVRGHQVRKNYKKIVWSVGILDKVILRWRRKGSGLRGFKPEALPEGANNMMQEVTSSSSSLANKEDEYDFLKKGRKQAEQRLQKALSRVKSMVQYPEARDQYRRLLNVVTEIQGTKAMKERALNHSGEAVDIDEDLVDLEALLVDDTFISTTPFQH